MVQKTSTTQSVWSELWHKDPALYLALQSTAIINNALLTLFLLAAFSIIYDMLRFWFRRRFFHAFGPPAPEPLSKLPSESYKCFTSLNAKATFYTTLFLVIQFATSYLLTHLSWLLADISLKNRNLRRRCSRLHARGLECSTAAHYHDALNIAGALVLLIFIRGLELHVKQPRSRTRDDNYSPGFLRLKAACRWFIQMLLAVPIAVIYLYTRAARQRPWSCLRLLLVQAAASCAVFLLGNFVCLVAALPDFQETMERLEGSGIMGVRG